MAQMTEETALLMLSYFLPMKPKARKALEFIRAKLKESGQPSSNRQSAPCPNCGERAGRYSLGEACMVCHYEL